MKRYFYRKNKVTLVCRELFGGREDYKEGQYEKYEALEIVEQEDGRFSVWGDLGEEDADLLRDTKPDHNHALLRVIPLADDVTND